MLSFSAQTKGTVRLVNAFYVTYGPQTIDFAIFVSMNPPSTHPRFTIWLEAAQADPVHSFSLGIPGQCQG